MGGDSGGIEQYMAEQFTGVKGTGNYRDAAARLGYEYLIPYDRASSAGNWTFLVSKDDMEYYWFYQHSDPFGKGVTHELGGWAITVSPDTDEEEILKLIEEGVPW